MKGLSVVIVLVLASAAWAAERPGVFDGTVLPFRVSQVNAKTVGNVSKILVAEGQAVKEGDVLAQLDDTLARANYQLSLQEVQDKTDLENAQALLAQAEKDLARAQKIRAQKVLSDVEMEKAEYAVKIARLAVANKQAALLRAATLCEGRKAALDEYAVRAPFSGIVAAKYVEVGETTAPLEKRLFNVIDISRVYVEVHPNIDFVKTLAVGDAATVKSELFEGVEFPAKVSFLAPAADLGGRSFGVKVVIENPKGLLRPEMKASVRFLPKDTAAQSGKAAAPREAAADPKPDAAKDAK